MSSKTAHGVSLFFGLVILALTLFSLMLPSPPVCGDLPKNYAPIIAFELARSVKDLHAIFGSAAGASCLIRVDINMAVKSNAAAT